MQSGSNNSQRQSRWWDLPSAVLVLVMLTTAFSRLIATKWSADLEITREIAYLGLVAGLALGYSRFSRRLVTLLSIVYGIFMVPWRLGLSLGADISWVERLQSIAGRLEIIFSYLLQQRAVPDNLLFVVLMCIGFWIISVHAGYTLCRYANPWIIALPGGLMIIIIQTYDALPTDRTWYVIIYLFLTLLLVVRMVYISHRRRWEQTRTYMPSYLGTDIVRFALLTCLLLMALAWSTPAVAKALPVAKESWDRVMLPWWNDTRNVFENAFASLRSTVGLAGEYYGPNLALGTGSILSDTVVFSVQAPTSPPTGIRYYWRARVYDTFNKSWVSSHQTTRAIDAQEIDLPFPDLDDDFPGAYPFTFYLNRPIATIMAPNQLVWLSRPTRAEFINNPDGSVDLGVLRATPSLRAGEIYSARVSFNNITIETLRQAGTGYPDWVRSRYLQLPSSITLRTRLLAAQIAEGHDTPYDIADAITNYLRINYEYSETIPIPPTDQEPIDWFLFDYGVGFCNYYATAEIILLRAMGIPARLAVGYAAGDSVDNPGFYTVRQRDSHAWPEVYFPGTGWVEFEPTASQAPIFRLQSIPESESELDPTDLGETIPNPEPESPLDRQTTGNPFGDGSTLQARLTFILSGALIVILVAISIPLIRRKRLHKKIPLLPIFLENAIRRAGIKPPRVLQYLARMATLLPHQRAYEQINLALRRLGRPASPTDTPAERAGSLVLRLPATHEQVGLVLTEYHRATYSPQNSANERKAQRAGDEIRRISIREDIRRRFGF